LTCNPDGRNGGILNHWLSTTACPTGEHLGQAHGQRRHLTAASITSSPPLRAPAAPVTQYAPPYWASTPLTATTPQTTTPFNPTCAT